MSKEVIILGGPHDGRIIAVEDEARSVSFLIPPDVRSLWAATADLNESVIPQVNRYPIHRNSPGEWVAVYPNIRPEEWKTNMTHLLITWLRTQIEHDEQVALGAARTDDGRAGHWTAVGLRSTYDARVDDHIAAWDPSRVLAEVKAKRAILSGYEASDRQSDDYPGWEGALYAIAQPYAGRDGWRPEWSVTG